MTILIPKSIKSRLPAQLEITLQSFLSRPTQRNYWSLMKHLESSRPLKSRMTLYAWLSYWLASEICIRQGRTARFFVPRDWDYAGCRLAPSAGIYDRKNVRVTESIVISGLSLVSDRSFEKLERWLSLGDG